MMTWTTFVKVSRRGGSLVAGPLVTTCLSSCLIYTVCIIHTTLHHNQEKDEEQDDGGGWWMVKEDEEQLLHIQHTTLHKRKDQKYDGDCDDHENEALRATLRSV